MPTMFVNITSSVKLQVSHLYGKLTLDMDLEGLFRPSQWKYRGEGHSSLVLFHLSEPRVVIRLKKKDLIPEATSSVKAHEEGMDYQLDFMRRVMSPLIGDTYVPVQRKVTLPQGFVEDMRSSMEQHRPRNRLIKGVEAGACAALLMPDVCFLPGSKPSVIPDRRQVETTRLSFPAGNEMRGRDSGDLPTFCVEIKPKCGFLPPPYDSIPDEPHCKFCLFQKIKVRRGKWTCPSKYCPLDLFSGNVSRVKTALRGLIETPQNNLRIFQDGQCLFAQDIESSTPSEQLESLKPALSSYFPGDPIESLMTVLSQILTEPSETPSSVIPPVCGQSPVKDNLPPNGTRPSKLLSSLLKIQKYDIAGATAILPYYSELSKDDVLPDEFVVWNFTSSPPHLHCRQGDDQPSFMSEIERYLLAATAKDCSIMIAIRPQTSPCDVKADEGDLKASVTYQYSVAVVDLDPKGIWRVKKYYEEDKEIVEAFTQSLGEN